MFLEENNQARKDAHCYQCRAGKIAVGLLL